MIAAQLVLFGILVVTPALWFRWWRESRFTTYSWSILVLMACTGVVYINFATLEWWRVISLFVFVLLLSIARELYARKRAVQ